MCGIILQPAIPFGVSTILLDGRRNWNTAAMTQAGLLLVTVENKTKS